MGGGVWPTSCNGKFLAVIDQEAQTGHPRLSRRMMQIFTRVLVSVPLHTSSEGAHISARGLHIYAFVGASAPTTVHRLAV